MTPGKTAQCWFFNMPNVVYRKSSSNCKSSVELITDCLGMRFPPLLSTTGFRG